MRGVDDVEDAGGGRLSDRSDVDEEDVEEDDEDDEEDEEVKDVLVLVRRLRLHLFLSVDGAGGGSEVTIVGSDR
eukprot:s8820_g2.t1